MRDGAAVLTIAALMSSIFQVGCAWTVSAAEPVTCGVAIDVPESLSAPLPVPTPVEKIDTPGAVISGLSALSSWRGPPDVKLANCLNVGLLRLVGVTVDV